MSAVRIWEGEGHGGQRRADSPDMRASRIDHSAMPPRDGWRDVAAAWVVHRGLQLASPLGRNRMLHACADEWRALLRDQPARTEKTRTPSPED